MKNFILQFLNLFSQHNKFSYLESIFDSSNVPMNGFIAYVDIHWILAEKEKTPTILKSNAHLAITYAIERNEMTLLKNLIHANIQLDHIADLDDKFIMSLIKPHYELSVFLFEHIISQPDYQIHQQKVKHLVAAALHASFQQPFGLSFIDYLIEKKYVVSLESHITQPTEVHLNYFNGYQTSAEICCQYHNYVGLQFLLSHDIDLVDDLTITSKQIDPEVQEWINQYIQSSQLRKSLIENLSHDSSPISKPKI